MVRSGGGIEWLIFKYIYELKCYTGFPVPFNECIYQLLNEYWPTGPGATKLENLLSLIENILK